MTDTNRMRLLKVMDIIRMTDEDNPVTANGIVRILGEYGIHTERKAVVRDIQALTDYGWDIIVHEDNKLGYYLAGRDFEDWELKVLTDAVAGANFLTEKNCTALTEKIRSLAGTETAKALKTVAPVETQIKSGDVTTKNNIDTLFRAIKQKKKVFIKYSYTGTDLKKHFKFTDEPRNISPYALIWRQDRYYLIANYGPEKKLSYYRLDRINSVRITDDPAVPADELLGPNPDMAIADFIQNNIYNKSGKKIVLELIADNNMVDTLLDTFGDDINISVENESSVRAVTSVSDEQGLLEWILRYSDRTEVIEPKELREEIKGKLRALSSKYQ